MRFMRIRPLEPEDALPTRTVAVAALPPLPGVDDAQRAIFHAARHERLLLTDREGCWVAEDGDGRVTGVALSLVRDGIWGLSLLAVAPDEQGRGTGRLLLDAALGYAAQARGAIIASSTDPAAMRLYALAGFALRPCVAAAGIVRREALPGGLRSRPAGEDDLELAAALGREVRGGGYDPEDLAGLLRTGTAALRAGDRGIALHRTGSPALLVARDEATAEDLLWSCLAAAAPGATVHADLVTAGQDWAVGVLLRAGLALSPDGPVFTRGTLGPLRPWLPSGAFL